jgi:anti-sigma factor RsiW
MHPDDLTLSCFVDDALEPAEQARVEEHLRHCDQCRRVVADLREIGRAAGGLDQMAPPAHLWPRIRAAIERESAGTSKTAQAAAGSRPMTGRWVAALAAAAVMVLVTVVGLRIFPADPAVPDERETRRGEIDAELQQAEQHYQKAIAGLEQIADAGKGVLDPQTEATLETNLAVIDDAIDESLAALQTEPGNEPAQRSLLESLKTKLALLQDAVTLMIEMRRGNGADAARILSGFTQEG